MQMLYQIDVTGETDARSIGQQLDDHDPPQVRAEAAVLATAAWDGHRQADALATKLAPQWPTYRQPPVDRAILRLACYEIISKRVPVKVAINEAVELAKIFGSKQSSAFINGVLDKMARNLKQVEEQQGNAAD